MISKQTKIFTLDNLNYQFDFQSFQTYVKLYAKKKKIRPIKVFGIVANGVNVSMDAVKQWFYGNNGPSELEMIQDIAKILNISDYINLMKKSKEPERKLNLTEPQCESLKRIYDSIIDYLNDFYKTDGFTGGLWYKFEKMGSKDPENDIYEYAINKVQEVNVIVQKEYFYLHDTDVYSELYEYVDNELYDIFDGKLSYAYRFEAIPDGNPTTEDDYNKALKNLNEIIEKYI